MTQIKPSLGGVCKLPRQTPTPYFSFTPSEIWLSAWTQELEQNCLNGPSAVTCSFQYSCTADTNSKLTYEEQLAAYEQQLAVSFSHHGVTDNDTCAALHNLVCMQAAQEQLATAPGVPDTIKLRTGSALHFANFMMCQVLCATISSDLICNHYMAFSRSD